MNHPEVVDRLAILDAAHPRSLQKGLRNPRQLMRSWYFFFFALPGLPERVVRADRFRFFRRFLRDARPPYTPEEIDRYVATGEWRHRAGGYAIQGLGSTLVERVEGDLSNVIGLPLGLLLELAPELGT